MIYFIHFPSDGTSMAISVNASLFPLYFSFTCGVLQFLVSSYLFEYCLAI